MTTRASSNAAFPPTEPIPVMVGKTTWRTSFAPLAVRNFRLFTISNVIAMSGTQMQRIAQDWLVLTLSHSATAVGVTVFMQFTPMLIFGLHGGLIVDRYSKRTLLMLTQGTVGVLSTLLAVLALTHTIQIWQVWTIAFLVGLVTVIDNPTRQVFVGELVGTQHLRNAVSLNASVFQLGGLIGPAVAGVLLSTVGAGWAFAINAVTCVITVLTLAALGKTGLARARGGVRIKGQLRQGFAYVMAKPAIKWSLVMGAILAIFTLPTAVILTAYAHDVFMVGASGYGLFNTLIAAGAFAGAILSTRRRRVRLRTVVIMGGVWGVLQAAAAIMPGEIGFCATLVAVGIANLLFITAANSLVQLSSNVAIRGRVMSFYVLVLVGGQAIGGPVMGWIVSTGGPEIGLAVSGLVPAVAALLICLVLARRHSIRFAAPRMEEPNT